MAAQGQVAFEGIVREIPGLKTVTDLSAKQFCFVKMSADYTVAIATDDTLAIGVLQNKPLGTSTIPVAAAVAGVGSVTKLLAAGTITYGQKLTVDGSTGGAVAVSEADDPVSAIALEGASSGDYLTAYLCGGATLAAA